VSRLIWVMRMGGGTFFKVGGAQVHVRKTVEIVCGLNWKL